MIDRENEIEQTLTDGVDKSADEYREQAQKADAISAGNGVKGRAALTEGQRHKRIQMNFYGSAINYFAAIYGAVLEGVELLKEIKEALNGGGNGNK